MDQLTPDTPHTSPFDAISGKSTEGLTVFALKGGNFH